MSGQQVPFDLFLLDRSNTYFVTGRHDDGNYDEKLRTMLLAFVILLVAVTAFRSSIESLIDEIQLASMPTATTEAEIIDLRQSVCGSGRSRSNCYFIRYRYTVNERDYSREESTNHVEYVALRKGLRFPVTYGVDNPSIAHRGAPGFKSSSLDFITLIVLGVIAVIGYFLYNNLAEMLDKRRFRRDGKLLFGQAIQIWVDEKPIPWIQRNKSGQKVEYVVHVEYTFETPRRSTLRGSAERKRKDLRKEDLPAPGSVAVLYIDDDNYRLQ